MKVRINLEHEATSLVRQMAEEAGLSVSFLCEVAIYNLIALWQKDRRIGIEPLDTHDGMDGGA